MDEILGVVGAVLMALARAAWFVVFDLVWEIVIQGAVTGLIWLVWPGGRKAQAQDQVERRRP